MNNSLFRAPSGKSYAFTFALVSSLFLLWGFCNGMIDIMDKHFQDQLSLTKAQSAWVQFAHYMGYAIMALPAGLLTRKIGYKGGIIFGLLLVAAGGFWFLPATSIAAFWAFLLGVCLIAMGLTVLETVANPYTTVLGPKEFAATRINLAQSMNGVGWIFGPIVGAQFFYAQAGASSGPVQIYVPYVGVGVVVLAIAVLFFFANVPDVKTEDDYHTDDEKPAPTAERQVNHGLAFIMMFVNVVFVGLSVYLVLHTILPFCGMSEANVNRILAPAIALATLATLPFLRAGTKTISTHSIWAHPHFSGATVAQFVYVAAQAGIFSFFINVMTVDSKTGFCLVPALPAGWADIGWLKGMFEAGKDGLLHISNKGAGTLASAGFFCFLAGRLVGALLMRMFSAHRILVLFATRSASSPAFWSSPSSAGSRSGASSSSTSPCRSCIPRSSRSASTASARRPRRRPRPSSSCPSPAVRCCRSSWAGLAMNTTWLSLSSCPWPASSWSRSTACFGRSSAARPA
jgi:FHS family L-fucose permease-like MFS transporter